MGKKSKRSAELALKILHKMLNDPTYKLRSLAQKVFNRLTVDQLKIMELGQQYQNHVDGNSRIKTENNVALEMIQYIKEEKKRVSISAIIEDD